MKIIPGADAAARASELVEPLAAGGLVCIPVRGAYRILADARSEAAITRLAQSKRRAHNRPALIIVANLEAAKDVVDGTQWKTTQKLAKKFWPGPLTLVLPPSKVLPNKIKKVLTRSTGSLGVRVPEDPVTIAILAQLGAPLLVSSANLEQKPGASSASTVRMRFERTVDVWCDAGDLAPAPPSTLVEVTETAWKLVREGAVAKDAIERVLG
jgi:L-threonylcarbamoyladenylate synthase